MPLALNRLALASLISLATAAPAFADSLASSASSAGSKSVGSLSDSITGSSNSSSGDNKVAEGDYRILEVAEVPAKPGKVRLKLQATGQAGPAGEFSLDLPQPTFARQQLAVRDVVSVRQRPYGLEFAHGGTREAFFLVLADDWHHELDPRAVTL
jgi:hypothetical protein